MKTLILILLTLNLSSQVKFTHFNDLSDFDKHRVTCTAIAWTGSIFACKLTHNCQWKGAVIGGGIAIGVGAGKELIYDKWMHKGVASWKDFGADCMGTVIGTAAGFMCNGVAQHIRDKREYERSLKFKDPFEVVDVQVKETDLEVK